MRTVRVGIIGSGFIADTRARCYQLVGGYNVELVAVAGRSRERAEAYASRWGIPSVLTDYRQLLDRQDVDLVDLCVPNYVHKEMVIAAAAAGKHVVCPKPLTGYFGADEGDTRVGDTPKSEMLAVVLRDAAEMREATERFGVQLMYAENWVYAPAIEKARRLVKASGGAILEMRGGERHSGSHSPYSKSWRYTGGGALVRLASHPIGAALHLKAYEGTLRNGQPIRAKSVTAETAILDPGALSPKPSKLVSGWEDVENWATVLIGFEDGTRAVLYGADTTLGGMESTLELSLTNARIQCRLGPTDLVQAYAPGPEVFASEYLEEKLETPAGWSHPAPDELWAHGHEAQAVDFVAAAAEGRAPLADGWLGAEVMKVIYSAYVAAEEGRRVELAPTDA